MSFREMRVLIRATLVTSAKSKAGGLCVSEHCSKLANALQTSLEESGTQMPDPWDSANALICSHLAGKANLNIIAPDEHGEHSAPSQGFTVVITSEDEKPGVEELVNSLSSRVKAANRRSDLSIQLQNEFYLYPIIDGKADDEGHYLLATWKRRTWLEGLELKKLVISLITLFVTLVLALGSSLFDIGFFGVIAQLLFGGVIALLLDWLVEGSLGKLNIDIGETLRNEERHLSETRTDAMMRSYEGKTPSLRRSSVRSKNVY